MVLFCCVMIAILGTGHDISIRVLIKGAYEVGAGVCYTGDIPDGIVMIVFVYPAGTIIFTYAEYLACYTCTHCHNPRPAPVLAIVG